MKTYPSSRCFVRAFFALALATAFLWTSPAAADWTLDTDLDIVITLKSNPMSHAETACLAVTLARVLKGAGGNVTLFPTLDGVALRDVRVIGSRRFKCETPFSSEPISLQENIEAFLSSDDDMVICPLCWRKRYDKYPDYGLLPPPCIGPGNLYKCTAVVRLLMNADKVIDF